MVIWSKHNFYIIINPYDNFDNLIFSIEKLNQLIDKYKINKYMKLYKIK